MTDQTEGPTEGDLRALARALFGTAQTDKPDEQTDQPADHDQDNPRKPTGLFSPTQGDAS